MMASKYIAPPPLVPEKYTSWRKEMVLWEMATNVEKKKMAPTVFLTLTGKAREAVLEMEAATLNENDGLEKLFTKLDDLFKEDKTQAALICYDKFERYSRPSEMSITDYLVEFERMIEQLKIYEISLPGPVLAYRALRSANISEEYEKIVKATVGELTFKGMSTQLKKVMLGTSESPVTGNSESIQIKKESVAYSEEGATSETKTENSVSDDVFYGRWSRNRGGGSYRRGRGGSGRTSSRQNWWRPTGGRSRSSYPSKKKTNPLGPDGKPSICNICGAFTHWARDCPEKSDEQYDGTSDAYIVLMAHEEKPSNETSLLRETIGCMVLDSGTTSTVGGIEWFNCFMETLPENARKKVKTFKGTRTFRFGSGKRLPSLKRVILPCVIGGVRVDISTDIVDADIPMLLSKSAMKKAKTIMDFKNDTICLLGKKMKLNTTTSGHYYVSITKPLPSDKKECQVLFAQELGVFFIKEIGKLSCNEKIKIAKKLHYQFSHCSGRKMSVLAKDSGITDREFLKICEEFPSNCDICLKLKRAEPRPVVGFSLATTFNETVALDLKDIRGHKILHLVDLATKYSVAVKIPNKESSTIITAVFKHWIAYFGAPGNFLTDNGREFDNQEFRDMCQNLNVVVMTTAAQSPWSNGVVERHNGILGEMVTKTMCDSKYPFETVLGWAVSAKNALGSVHGYSSNQLVFGRNPNLPSILVDRPPALEGVSTSQVVANNLNLIHANRKAYIECESSEKLRRALRHQIRPSLSQKYNNGDRVYYKRNESTMWMGPGTVIGWESKQVLVKHGGTYVRVHPCRLRHCSTAVEESMSDGSSVEHAGDMTENKDQTGVLPETEDLSEEDIVEENNQEDVPVECHGHNAIQGQDMPATTAKRGLKISDLPKPGQIIQCETSDGNVLQGLKIISRAGKATGSNKFFMNVVQGENRPFCLDFENSVNSWEATEETKNEDGASEDTSEIFLLSVTDPLVEQAKQKELSSWIKNEVYTVVPDVGQSRITTRWICREKLEKGTKLIKARLVARGFQDENAGSVRTDSPTCSKEGLKFVLCVIMSYGWSCNSLDIKTAFLQSEKMDRPVHLLPPPEAKCKVGKLWKLSKCVYGLNDASRSWYLTVKKELLQLGAEMSKLDQAVFTWYHQGKLHGIISTHVDDFCWGGTKVFSVSVIDKIKKKFEVRSEESTKFKYVGLEVEQKEDKIVISQDKYVETLQAIPVPSIGDDMMSPEDETSVRQVNGKLNWIATQTRPDLSFDVSEFGSFMKKGKLECIKQANKNIAKAKKEKSRICIPNLGNLNELSIIAYTDASFANLVDGGSQGGYIIFVVGSNGNYFPLHWQSKRIRRVAKSTQAAETLAMVDLVEACVYYKFFLCELLHIDDMTRIKVICKTDNSGMHDSSHSSTQILDKRLRIEMAILREMLSNKEITEITWVPNVHQIADALTKRGVPSSKILRHLTGHGKSFL